MEYENFDEYKKLDYKEFILHYPIALTYECFIELDFEGEESDINYTEIEINFLKKLNEYFYKRGDILMRFFEHAQNTNRYNQNEIYYELAYELTVNNNRKYRFIAKRISELDNSIKLKSNFNLISETLKQTNSKKESKTNLLNGQKLNLLERYEIARRVFDLDKQIRTIKVSEGEKDKLLSLILDCNTINARHIMNGKYPGKVREDLISQYVKGLKE